MAKDFLLRLTERKYVDIDGGVDGGSDVDREEEGVVALVIKGGPQDLVSSPTLGRSIFNISAPMSPRS